MNEKEIRLLWQGPFTWPKYDSGIITSFNSIPREASGVYLWAFEYCDGFLIYAAGLTRRSFYKRFREHTKSFVNGVYTIFDIPALRQGIRKEIWHGFWTKERSPEKQKDYESRRDEITDAAREQLSAFRVFVAQVEPAPRILERLEAAIMNELYMSPPPISDIPDRGMSLAPRWNSEPLILVKNILPVKLYGLPESLNI